MGDLSLSVSLWRISREKKDGKERITCVQCGVFVERADRGSSDAPVLLGMLLQHQECMRLIPILKFVGKIRSCGIEYIEKMG